VQASNAAYDAIAQRGYNKPIHYIVFSGISTRFATHRVTGATVTYRRGLKLPSSTGGTIKILEGKAEIEDLNFGIVDRKNRISELVQTNDMYNRAVTLYQGFEGLDESNFLVRFQGNVRSATFDGTTWRFECPALENIQKSTVFTDLAETELTDDALFDDTVIDVDDTSAFDASGFLRVGKEMMQYGAKTATQFQGLTRGYSDFGDGATAHSEGDTVKEIVRLNANPVTAGLQIITSTGLGTNGAYDVLPAARGLGLEQAKVDIAGFEEERDEWISGLSMDFYLDESFEAKKFLEEELWAVINAYPRIRADGQQSLRLYASPLPTESRVALDESVIRGVPRWDKNYRDIRNRVEVLYDYDPIDDEFDKIYALDDTDSQSDFGVVKTHRVESKGFRSTAGTEIFIRAFAGRLLARFADPPARLKGMKLHLRESLLEVGDLVEVTHRRLPNDSGGKGIVGDIYEVLDRSIDWGSGEITVEALATKFSVGGTTGRIFVIAPNTAPDFDVATDDDKEFGYICLNTGLMPDGTGPYNIA